MADVYQTRLTDAQFRRISDIVYRLCGINLKDGKEELVKTRLTKRLRALGLSSFDEYVQGIEDGRDTDEIVTMIDCLTTNKTSFFRESTHFDYLRTTVLPKLDRHARIWSAGCSSGEEPYTLAIVLSEMWPDIAGRDVAILATDISTHILAKARAGVYTEETLIDVPPAIRTKYFTRIDTTETLQYTVRETLRRFISFARLNLMEPWPMRGPFDAIFCRNVMIYFDKETQTRLVRRFYDYLPSGGHLFVGHSESLTAIEHPFRYVQAAAYRKD